MDAVPSPSPALLEANRRLYELRAHAQAGRPAAEPSDTAGRELPSPKTGYWPPALPGLAEAVAALPAHLGWGSEAATRAIRVALVRHGQEKDQEDDGVGGQGDKGTGGEENPGAAGEIRGQEDKGTDGQGGSCRLPSACSGATIVKHYPSLGLAALKADDVPAFRVWLAGRYLDRDGRGWLEMQQVRGELTGTDSPLQLCGWRRLRQVLGQGDGRYWRWDKEGGRLWLFGVGRVAVELGVERLSGRPVGLPVEVLTGDIGVFKAHLYGAWHSGRRQANPISRPVQQELTGVPERTQRHYCRVAGVKRRQNIAIGGKYSQEAAQECAWRRGRAVFAFHDGQGRLGRRGGRYVAWRMAATHVGPHETAGKGRQRKVNRKLKDLVKQVARGNGSGKVCRLYYLDGAVAVKAYNRNPHVDAHWQQSPGAGYQVWGALAAK